MNSFKTILSFLLFLIISNSLAAQNNILNQAEGSTSISMHPNIEKLVRTKFSEKYGDYYKIQLFYGNLDKAHNTLNKFNKSFSEWPGKILFETPNYKVWVGDYRTRLEADRALLRIRKEFPSAFIFKPKNNKS